MKRTITFLLALTMMLCLFSCGKEESKKSDGKAYEIYQKAEEKTNSLTAYHAVMKQDSKVTMSGDGETTVSMSTTRKANLTDSENPVCFYNIVIKQDSTVMESSSVYHKDGITYSDTSNGKYYYSQTASEIVDEYSSPATFDIDSAAFDNAELVTLDDGYNIYIKASDNSLDDFAMMFASAIFGSEEATIENAEVTLDINGDGYLYSLVFKFAASDDSISSVNTISVEFKAPGTEPSITEPDNLSEYPSKEEFEAQQAADTTDTDTSSDASSDTSAETSEWDNVTDEEGEAVDAAFALFDEDYNKVSNYDELYKEACDKYGKDTMDSIIEVITALTSLQ